MAYYRLVESDIQVPPELANKQVAIDWNYVEHMLGTKISSDVKQKYEKACTGKSFKVMLFLTLFSKIGNVAHLMFMTQYVLKNGLSERSFSLWAGVIAIQCISYLYKWWFIAKNKLRPVSKTTGEEIVNEGDASTIDSKNLPKARKQLVSLWSENEKSDSKFKWIITCLLIMIASLLGKYVMHANVTEQYDKQYKRIKRFQEQDAQPQQQKSQMPDAKQLMNMNPEQAQKAVENFMNNNNISNGKQFAALYRNAVRADMQQIRQEGQKLQQQNPEEFEKMKQQASANRGKSFFALASDRYINALTPMSILTTILFSVIFGGKTGILEYTLSTTIPYTLVGGWGMLGSVAFMAAKMMAGDKNIAASKLTSMNKVGRLATKGMMFASIGLVCCCAIRWIYKFLMNPRKTSKEPIINKIQFSKELGGDAIADSIQQIKTKTSGGYVTENVLCINEGLISYIKNKIMNFLKTTWNCMKTLVSNSGLSKWLKRILTFLAIGLILACAYFKIPTKVLIK